MLAKTFAAAVQGIDAITVTVEVVVDRIHHSGTA